MPLTASLSPETEIGLGPVRYQIEDRVTVTAPRAGRRTLEIWTPVILENVYQRVLDIAIDAPDAWSITNEPEFGNPMLHGAVALPSKGPLDFAIRYLVERVPVFHDLSPSRARSSESQAVFARALAPEKFVDVDDRTASLAAEIVGGEANSLRRARRIYDYVAGKMAYDATKQSWKGSTEHALVCSVGNCNDIHALFISLVRSLGIPARLVLGQALEPPPPGQEACDLCGYHCWTEFFVSGLGWVPADASCACKYGKDQLFGRLEMNHIAWSVGRDIRLSPPQKGDRVLFFAGPYAELDGQPYPSIDRRIKFAEMS